MLKYFFIILIIGCTGNSTATRGAELANKNLYKKRSPVRVETKVLNDRSAIMSRVWAGKKGTSIINMADSILKKDVENIFLETCGYQKSDLKEVRIVEHNHPFYYEVWIFDNKRSKGLDGETGVSLILKFSKSGGTDINLVGKCNP